MDKMLSQLEQHLRELLREHEQLLTLIERKEQALRHAQPDLVSDCCRRENQHVQRIGAIEKRRQVLVGQITRQIDPAGSQPFNLRQIAEHASPAQRDRLMVLHAELRQLMVTIKQRNDVARRATEGLLHHVQGVMHAVGQAFASVGVYGRKGVNMGAPAVVSSFTITG
jgi:hypothetical protein